MKTETHALTAPLRRKFRAAGAALPALSLSLPAQAHVKWFAPYIVETPPQRVAETLADASWAP